MDIVNLLAVVVLMCSTLWCCWNDKNENVGNLVSHILILIALLVWILIERHSYAY